MANDRILSGLVTSVAGRAIKRRARYHRETERRRPYDELADFVSMSDKSVVVRREPFVRGVEAAPVTSAVTSHLEEPKLYIMALPKFSDKDYSYAGVAHELGHIKLTKRLYGKLGKSRSGRRLAYWYLHMPWDEVLRYAPALAVAGRKGKIAAVMLSMPALSREFLASVEGYRLLKEQGKATREEAVPLFAYPVGERVGHLVEGIGKAEIVRGVAEEVIRRVPVRGYVRVRNGKREPVRDHYRSIRKILPAPVRRGDKAAAVIMAAPVAYLLAKKLHGKVGMSLSLAEAISHSGITRNELRELLRDDERWKQFMSIFRAYVKEGDHPEDALVKAMSDYVHIIRHAS